MGNFHNSAKTCLFLKLNYFFLLSRRTTIQILKCSQIIGLFMNDSAFSYLLPFSYCPSLSFEFHFCDFSQNTCVVMVAMQLVLSEPLYLLQFSLHVRTTSCYLLNFHSTSTNYTSKRRYFCWLSENVTIIVVGFIEFWQISSDQHKVWKLSIESQWRVCSKSPLDFCNERHIRIVVSP